MNTFNGSVSLLGGFIAGVLGGLLVMLLGHPIAEIFQQDNPLIYSASGSDVIAVANTYIVFTTFIFVLITIIVTGLGIWFTKWFGLTKHQEIRENMHDFFHQLDKDSELANRFVKSLFDHKEISDLLHQVVQARVESEVKSRTGESDENIDFSNDLS
jgi:hypothetical protein